MDNLVRGHIQFSSYNDFLNTIQPKVEKPKQSAAMKKVIKYLENQYMDLEMSIDNCQGCMDGLEDAFEELAIYKTILASLGVDLNDKATMQRITDEWFAKMKHEEEVEKAKMNNFFEHVDSSIDLLISKNPKDKILFDVVHKTNMILNYLKEK